MEVLQRHLDAPGEVEQHLDGGPRDDPQSSRSLGSGFKPVRVLIADFHLVLPLARQQAEAVAKLLNLWEARGLWIHLLAAFMARLRWPTAD